MTSTLKRTGPIVRRTPMVARSRLTRTKPMTQARPKSAPLAIRRVVLARDGHCCRCGTRSNLVTNHRLSGMGGNRPEDAASLHVACAGCNVWFEDNPTQAYAHGWKLKLGWGPTKTPLAVFNRLTGCFDWVLLKRDGTAVPCLPPAAFRAA